MVPRINIEKIKEETWNNLERKSISHGEAVPVQARYQEGRDFLHPSSQTESRSPESTAMGRGWRTDSVLGPKGASWLL